MKKRKRKIKSQMIGLPVTILPMLTITLYLSAATAAILFVAGRSIKVGNSNEATATYFDTQHHLLNVSAPIEVTAANLLLHQRPLNVVSASEPHKQITTSTTISKEEYEDAGSEAASLKETSNLLQDDLLAVESSNIGSGRLLSGNSRPAVIINPPYATTHSNLTSISGNHNVSNHLHLQQQPLNDSQLAKLYRSPQVPTFIGRYGGRQDLRILATPAARQHLTQQQEQRFRYQPVPTATLLPVTTWHSLYFPRPPLRSTSTTTIAPPSTETVYKDFSFGLKTSTNNKSTNSNNRATSSSVDYWHNSADNKDNTTRSQHQFPRLLGQSSDSAAEDNFERSLALGSYQRTNASNMSWPQLLRQATESNVMESLMVTNKSMVSLLCDTDDMLIRLKFKQPFRGQVSSSLDSRGSNNCRLSGTGAYYYEMRIPLQDCGTRQEMPRLFINNIRIQFHQSGSTFDTIDDELKTIICSYPIKPLAPPPPELQPDAQDVLPERIIEAPNEPARLIYYEPLVLISGLLFLSLSILGFTTGAYVVAKRYRGSRALRFGAQTENLSPSSSRIYRNSPAQAANYLVAPPLIGIGKRKLPSNIAVATELKYPDYPSADRGFPDVDELRPAARSAKGSASVAATAATSVRLNPGESSDSLARNDNSSITTIEIPYNNSTKSFPQVARSEDSLSRSRNKPELVVNESKDSVSPQQSPTPTKQVVKDTQKSSGASGGEEQTVESKPTEQHQPVYVRVLHPADTAQQVSRATQSINQSAVEDLKGNNNQIDRSKDILRSYSVRDNKSVDGGTGGSLRFRKVKYKTAVAREREVQKGISRIRASPTYGSLRSRLTSPREYKRLQGIARLFDEILIESREDQGDKGSVLVYKSRLSPSKYKSKILDTMDDNERRQLGNLLARDELFRSYVVDSLDRDTFHRKLRENPAYADKFTPETWLLLEEIVLDPDVNSETITGSALDPTRLESSEGLSSASEEDSTRAIVLDNMDMDEVKSSPVNYRYRHSDIINDAGDVRELDDRESILVEVDAREANISSTSTNHNRDDSLDSDGNKTITFSRRHRNNSPVTSPTSFDVPVQEVQHKDVVRVSQFNSTAQEGGMTGTLINIDSVTNFTSSKDFSTFTRSRIEHTRYEAQVDDSLPYVDERVGDYDYTKETLKMSPKLSTKSANKRFVDTLQQEQQQQKQQIHRTLTRDTATTSRR